MPRRAGAHAMLTHIVCFRFNDLDHAAEAAKRLLSMKGRIPSLLDIEAGVDTTRSDRCWELGLITRFADREGLSAYATHPAHLEVVEYIRAHAEASIVVDF
jgi:hypothetical protein